MSELKFPEGFLWGTATASYQIEGSPLADGAGPSIWHTFSHTPNTVKNGDTGDIACDHYNRYKDDVALMKNLGMKGYRFSIAWPRIFPEGKGRINEKGLDFYDRLVDEILEAGITPFATVYHWDLPSALQNLGGWANRDMADWFADYSDYLFQRLGDRVKNWITLNEPWVFAFVANLFGEHAPGMKDIYTSFAMVHNSLRAHSKAVDAFRARNTGGKIGITFSNGSHTPASDSEEDVLAAKVANEFTNYPLYLNPICFGKYPEHLLPHIEEYLPEGYGKDMADIQRPIDFVGINYYTGDLVKADEKEPFGIKSFGRGLPVTEMDWEIHPEGLHDVLTGLHNMYHPKEVYITENGAAFDDVVENGEVHDSGRLEYLKAHFASAHRAISDGVNLKGYFVWSLMDNFEWAQGYTKRFGIVHVDYETQKRTPKDSAKWFSKVIADNGIV